MLARDLVDFDDLLSMPVTLLSRQIELVEHYRARYKWICVDEYQDVDELQYRLLQELTPPTGNLCAIGDPDQAIYSFRGADVGFFLRFQRDFPTARTVQLTRNYRSSPVIVAGAVAAIKPSTLVPDRELQAMRPATDDLIGIYPAADEEAEAQFVVQTIEELLGGSSFHSRDSGRVSGDGVHSGLSFDDIAVLYRTDAQARPVMEALSREGLPFQKRSHSALSGHPGVQELMKHFEVAPDSTSLLLKRAAQQVPEEFADSVQDALELLLPLAARHAPAEFVAELSLGAEVDTWDPRANRISLLTLHAAKGLEFPIVVLADPTYSATRDRPSRHIDSARSLWLEPLCGAMPIELLEAGDLEMKRDRAEANRVAYVAATRARDLLVVPVCGDQPIEGWLEVLNPMLYPAESARGNSVPAPGCPAFGTESVLERGPKGKRPSAGSVRPGLHVMEVVGAPVAWWDPAVLNLETEELAPLRHQRLLELDTGGAAAAESTQKYEAWKSARQSLLGRASEPSLRVQTVTSLVRDADGSGTRTEPSVDVRVLERDDPDRPGGRRFGSLVHALFASIDLGSAADALKALASVQGRMVGATEDEIDALFDAF